MTVGQKAGILGGFVGVLAFACLEAPDRSAGPPTPEPTPVSFDPSVAVFVMDSVVLFGPAELVAGSYEVYAVAYGAGGTYLCDELDDGRRGWREVEVLDPDVPTVSLGPFRYVEFCETEWLWDGRPVATGLGRATLRVRADGTESLEPRT